MSTKAATVRSNPFSTRYVRPGSLPYRFADADAGADEAMLDDIVTRLRQHRGGLIVGPHGSGKSTLLQTLLPQLTTRYAAVTQVRLSAPLKELGAVKRAQHARRMAGLAIEQQTSLGDGGLLVLDGAEQLWRLDWKRLIRRTAQRGQSVLATAHSPMSGLPVLYETHVTRELVQELTQSLLVNEPDDIVAMVEIKLRDQDWTTLSNVRDLWFELYDVVQPAIHR